MTQAAEPPVSPQRDQITRLCGRGFISRRRAETAQPHSWTVPASMTKPRLSNESRRASLAAAFWGSTQTTSTPVGRRKSTSQSSAGLEGIERAPPPIDQRDVVLAGRMAAVRRGCCANVAAALQLEHQFDAPGAGDDDSVLLRATCKRDHRFDDSIACRSGERRIMMSPFWSDDCLKLTRGRRWRRLNRRLAQGQPEC